jgi:hypothetical protein
MERPGARTYIWYKSAEAEEPRRGIRDEGVQHHDLALDLPGDIQALSRDLEAEHGDELVATFLIRHPRHRATIERIFALELLRYHSPHMNMLSEDFVPAPIIRLVNAAFFGLDKTCDVANSLNRWIRGVLFHGAPTRDDLPGGGDARWYYPAEPTI